MHNRLKKILLSFFSLVSCIFIAEISLRLFTTRPQMLYSKPAQPSARRSNENKVIESTPHAMHQVTSKGRRLTPSSTFIINNHNISGQTVTIRTNSLGFRGPELTDKVIPRVLFLGDSITCADYLPEEKTFVSIIGHDSKSTTKPIETLNAGVSSIGLRDELAILEEVVDSTSPELVILCLYLNDAMHSPGIKMTPVPRLFRSSVLIHHACKAYSVFRSRFDYEFQSELTPAIADHWLENLKVQYPASNGNPLLERGAFNKLMHENVRDWGGAWSSLAWDEIRILLEEYKRISLDKGFSAAVIIFPVSYQVEAKFIASEPQSKAIECCTDLDLPVLDLLPLFRVAHKTATDKLFYDQCHPTEQGNKLVAEWLSPFVRKLVTSISGTSIKKMIVPR